MKIDTEEIRTAFKIVDMVDTQPGLLSSQFVRVESAKDTLKLSLTGLCVGQASCPVAEAKDPWTWFVDRRVLGAFLSSSKAKTISVTLTKDALVWQGGRQKITAAGMEAVTGYSEWKPSKDAQKLSLTAELRKELAVQAQYAPTTAAADYLSAIVVNKGYGVFASDSFVIVSHLDKTRPASLRLPVTLSSVLTATNGTPEALIEKDGAGVRYPNGYIYQPLNANCITNYPLKKIMSVIDGRLTTPAIVRIKAKAFADALSQIKAYIFGSSVDLSVTCQQSASAGYASLALDVVQGKAQTSVAAEFKADFKLSWMIAKVAPWVEYISSLDPEVAVNCGQKDGCYTFSATVGKYPRWLVVAEA